MTLVSFGLCKTTCNLAARNHHPALKSSCQLEGEGKRLMSPACTFHFQCYQCQWAFPVPQFGASGQVFPLANHSQHQNSMATTYDNDHETVAGGTTNTGELQNGIIKLCSTSGLPHPWIFFFLWDSRGAWEFVYSHPTQVSISAVPFSVRWGAGLHILIKAKKYWEFRREIKSLHSSNF